MPQYLDVSKKLTPISILIFHNMTHNKHCLVLYRLTKFNISRISGKLMGIPFLRL